MFTSIRNVKFIKCMFQKIFITAVYVILLDLSSNCKDVSCMHKLTQVDLYIFFGRHLARLRRLLDKHAQRVHLSPRYGHVTLISGFLVLTAV